MDLLINIKLNLIKLKNKFNFLFFFLLYFKGLLKVLLLNIKLNLIKLKK